MARILSVEINPILGKQVIDIITAGMYKNPLAIYREYIQNAVDSIDNEKNMSNDHSINIQIEGSTRSVVILDNGSGVSINNIDKALLCVGHSGKTDNMTRGFRGIGRLGGLGYCDKLIFETKARGDSIATKIEWDGILLRQIVADNQNNLSAEDIISRIIEVQHIQPSIKSVNSYFKVTLNNITKFHGDELLNIKSVGSYISKNAPVPYLESFAHSNYIEKHLSVIPNFREYTVTLNGKKLFKPYNNDIYINGRKHDEIKGVELFQFLGVNNKPLAYGWYAVTNFMSALPKASDCRGVIVKDGNISVGNEYFFGDYYTENRFATWHIGEVHIVNGTLKPNARRDGFVNNVCFEKFTEQANLLCRHLSKLSRNSSKQRSAEINAEKAMNVVEAYFYSKPVILDDQHYLIQVDVINSNLKKVKDYLCNCEGTNGLDVRYNKAMINLREFQSNSRKVRDLLDGRTLWRKNNKSIIEDICRTILDEYSSCESSSNLIRKVIQPYIK